MRILLLSVLAALGWLVLGAVGSASADEAPAADHSLVGSVGSALGSLTGDVTTALAFAPVSVPNLVTPVAQRLDAVVAALPVVDAIVASGAVEALTVPVTSGVVPIDALTPAAGVVPAAVAPVAAVAPNHGAALAIGRSEESEASGAAAPSVDRSPPAPSSPGDSSSPGTAPSTSPSGASGSAAVSAVPGSSSAMADCILGRRVLPHNDPLPFSLSLAPGSSPD